MVLSEPDKHKLAKAVLAVNGEGQPTRTDINRKDLEDESFLKMRVARIPLGRVMGPEDLVGAAVFLASADSDSMTGTTLQVDGGRGIA